MLGAGRKLGAAALLALFGAGAAVAPAATPTADGWSADPDSQFLLDVKLRRLRLGDGVRAYQTPEGTCIILGDFLTTLDVPMKIDLTANTASGWAFKEQHKISIDAASGVVTYGNTTEIARARNGARNSGGLVRRQRGFVQMVRNRREGQHGCVGTDLGIGGQTSCRACDRTAAKGRPPQTCKVRSFDPTSSQDSVSDVARARA